MATRTAAERRRLVVYSPPQTALANPAVPSVRPSDYLAVDISSAIFVDAADSSNCRCVRVPDVGADWGRLEITLVRVEAQEPAETFPAVDLSNAIGGLGGHAQVAAESRMMPFLVMVLRDLLDQNPRTFPRARQTRQRPRSPCP